jgi:hypothetical protein
VLKLESPPWGARQALCAILARTGAAREASPCGNPVTVPRFPSPGDLRAARVCQRLVVASRP